MSYNDDGSTQYAPDDRFDDVDEFDDGYDDQGRYERLPRPPRRGSPLVVTLVALFAVIGILVAGTLVWATRQMNPSGDPGDKVASVEIPPGANFTRVAEILQSEGVITSARVMGWYAKFNDVPGVEAGRYVDFRKNSSMSEAVDVLAEGPVPAQEKVVTIIPGMWLDDALLAINKVFPQYSIEQLQLTLVGPEIAAKYHTDPAASWEGYLLPETYRFAEDATPVQILQKLVNQFDSTLDELGYDNAQARTGRSATDLVTIASMVERETGDPPEERPKMARVIFNRLDTDMTLGIDATILYGLKRRGNEGGLTKTELETPGPYNSRKNLGLPPTAISLPSEESLKAAINPTEGPWTYYVLETIDPRAHFFTDSVKEFNAAKARCQDNGFC